MRIFDGAAAAPRWPTLALGLSLAACGSSPVAPTPAAPMAPAPELIVLQLNDVYEINPVGGAGGLARVAALRERLAAEAPVLTVMAGDFLSPSAMGTVKIDGERVAGAQMVPTLDAMGLDVATLGNHEFDLKEAQLLARIAASKFAWVSSNITGTDGSPLAGVKPRLVRDVGGIKVGIFSVTLDARPQPWVTYDTDYLAVARREVAALKAEGADVIIALTHLDLPDDINIAARVPEVDMVLGGHEHENWRVDRGQDLTPVRKADANARTVYVHRVTRRDGQDRVDSTLVPITDALPDEPKTAAVAAEWTEKVFAGYRAQGLDPTASIGRAWTDLDGLESSVRSQSTALTEVIAESFATGECTVSVFNSGSIRIDDVIRQGSPITAYDVARILPFGGHVVSGDWTGALLQRVVDAGQENRGKGGWLQLHGASGDTGAWAVGGAPLDPAATYRVCTTDFMLLGLEANLKFLTREVEGLSDPKDEASVQTLLVEGLTQKAAR